LNPEAGNCSASFRFLAKELPTSEGIGSFQEILNFKEQIK